MMTKTIAHVVLIVSAAVGITLGAMLTVVKAAQATPTAVEPTVTVRRAGIFCVYVSSTGQIALTSYEVYSPALRLVDCPAVGDPGPMTLNPPN